MIVFALGLWSQPVLVHFYHFAVRAAPVEGRKSTGSTQSETRGTADWEDGWDEDGAH